MNVSLYSTRHIGDEPGRVRGDWKISGRVDGQRKVVVENFGRDVPTKRECIAALEGKRPGKAHQLKEPDVPTQAPPAPPAPQQPQTPASTPPAQGDANQQPQGQPSGDQQPDSGQAASGDANQGQSGDAQQAASGDANQQPTPAKAEGDTKSEGDAKGAGTKTKGS